MPWKELQNKPHIEENRMYGGGELAGQIATPSSHCLTVTGDSQTPFFSSTIVQKIYYPVLKLKPCIQPLYISSPAGQTDPGARTEQCCNTLLYKENETSNDKCVIEDSLDGNF
jgi:hypothetical protein